MWMRKEWQGKRDRYTRMGQARANQGGEDEK